MDATWTQPNRQILLKSPKTLFIVLHYDLSSGSMDAALSGVHKTTLRQVFGACQ